MKPRAARDFSQALPADSRKYEARRRQRRATTDLSQAPSAGLDRLELYSLTARVFLVLIVLLTFSILAGL